MQNFEKIPQRQKVGGTDMRNRARKGKDVARKQARRIKANSR